jgi:hypothetical protein
MQAHNSSSKSSRRDRNSNSLLPSTIDWDQQQQQQQQQGQLQRQQQGPGASLARQQLPQIPEGELMSLIAAASSITDIERLLLQFHNQFK